MGWFSNFFSPKYEVGYSETFSLGFGIELIFKNESSWHIWKAYNRDTVTYFLCKPAIGVSIQPKPKGCVFINEGNGFYCLDKGKKHERYFSFYGKHTHRGRALCQYKGKFTIV